MTGERDAGGPGERWRPSREQWLLALVVGIFAFGADFATPFLPLYILELGVRDFSTAAIWSGVLLGATPLLSGLTAPLWGSVADRFGARRLLAPALVGFAAVVSLMGLADSVWPLLGLRVVAGLMGGITPLAMTLMLGLERGRGAGRAISLVQVSQLIPLAVAPALGGLLADQVGLRANFVLAGGLMLGAFLILVVGMRPTVVVPRPPPTAIEPTVPRPTARGAAWSVLAFPLLLLFVAQFADRSLQPTIPLFATRLLPSSEGVASTAGIVLSAGAVATAVSSLIYGRLVDVRPLQGLLVAALGAGAVLCVPFALVTAPWQLLALRIVFGLLAGGISTLAYALGTSSTTVRSRGRRVGLLTSGVMFGNAMGPLVAGAVAAQEIRAVFFVDAALFALVLTGLLARRLYARCRPFGAQQPRGSG